MVCSAGPDRAVYFSLERRGLRLVGAKFMQVSQDWRRAHTPSIKAQVQKIL